MSFGLYFQSESCIHRLSPGLKVASLFVGGTIVFVVSDWRLLLGGLGTVLLLHAVGRVPWQIALGQVRPVLWLLALVFVVQVFIDGWTAGLVVTLRFTTLILLAALVTLTTSASAMIDALEAGLRPLSTIGINPGKAGLALSLALRFIPVISAITQDVQEAQRARGLHRNMVALAVPVIIRTLKMAEDIADAIEARSYDPKTGSPARRKPSADVTLS